MRFIYLELIAIIPLFVFIADGYYEKNIKRGLYQILAFLITAALAIILLKSYRLLFVMSIPVLFVALIAAFKK